MSQTQKINGDSDNNANCNGSMENGSDISARKAALTPLEFRVTQQRETERPFSNKYNKFWETGTYHCVVCEAELFRSETKFESKSGWPAFNNVVDPQRVKLTPDLSHVGANLLLLVAKPDLARTEVSCANCNAHLGHLFKDGPKPTGLRYCINSASLNFISSDGTLIINNLSSPTVTNGNGTITTPIREFVCNPENTCSRPLSVASTPISVSSTPTVPTKEFSGARSARDNFFSSFESNANSIPPMMGALCINNQSCQRIIVPKKPASQDTLKSNFISNGAENNVKVNSNGVSSIIKNSSSGSTRNGTGTQNFPSNKTNQTSSIANTNSNTTSSTTFISTTTTPVSSKSKFQFPKGASLTAARINFFQKISSKQDSSSSPSRWATAFNTKRSASNSNKSSISNNNSSSNNTQDNPYHHGSNGSSLASSPFRSSCSSGSLSATFKTLNPKETHLTQPRRSASTFFTSNSSSAATTPPIEQVSTPPRAISLRETTL